MLTPYRLVRQPRAGFGGRRVSGRIGRVTQQAGHVAYDQASSGLRGARNS